MIDNPESGRSQRHYPICCDSSDVVDIAGANGAGWESVLVHTGVYDPAKGSPPHEPSYQAADVEKAVIQAISHECRVE